MRSNSLVSRVPTFDAVRGLAMLFVFVSHFSWTLQARRRDLAELFGSIGMVATPMFLMLSGMMLGMLWRVRQRDFSRVQELLLNRGVVLICAHFLIALCVVPAYYHHWDSVIKVAFVTDAIAFAVIAGPLVLRNVPIERVPWLALGLYVFSWIAVELWQPHWTFLLQLKNVLVGIDPRVAKNIYSSSPLLQYFAFYLAGAWVGAQWVASGDGMRPLDTLAARLFAVGAACVALALALRFVGAALVNGGGIDAVTQSIFFSRYQKFPPGPGYALFYGGLAWIMCAIVCRADALLQRLRVIPALAVLGRASLFIFVVQFFIYFGLPLFAADVPSHHWIAYFLGSVVLLWLAAWVWSTLDGNRYLTVGIRLPGGGTRADSARAS